MIKSKILLIEDELKMRNVTTDLLVFKNYEVKAVGNGQEALDLLDNWTPDLIICDIMMPVMNGYEFHEIVKDTKTLSAIPFIFLTGKKENNLMRKCLLDGADDFISKPFKARQFFKIIETKIDRFQKIKNIHNNLYVGKKKHFLSEVNTPLSDILSTINLLIADPSIKKRKDINIFYKTIKASGERLNRTMQNLIIYENLINNSLDFNNSEQSEILSVFSEVKNKIFKMNENEAQRITFDIDESNLNINKEYLNLILFELIDNALKFSAITANVMIYGALFNDKYYELTIADFGIGFSENQLKKINAAQQFNEDKREPHGLGLGLYLSKTIIKKAKGVFSIISEESKGTKISLFFPLKLPIN